MPATTKVLNFNFDVKNDIATQVPLKMDERDLFQSSKGSRDFQSMLVIFKEQ